jgi:hypothetical protein
MAEWLKATDCKSADMYHRRFESYSSQIAIFSCNETEFSFLFGFQQGKKQNLRPINRSNLYYSHSRAPFFHSYINPIVKISKKRIIDQNPKKSILLKETAQGNKKVTSKSKIINKIATK